MKVIRYMGHRVAGKRWNYIFGSEILFELYN